MSDETDETIACVTASCPRCDLLFSVPIEDEIARLLSYREQEVLKSADDLFKKCGLNQHAVIVRELLDRLGGGR